MKRKSKIVIFFALVILIFLCGFSIKENSNQESIQEFKEKKGLKEINVQVTPAKNDSAAIVTVISDDGDYESGIILNKLLQKHDLRATVSIYVENAIPHLKSWQKIEDMGHIELVSHSYSHIKIAPGTNNSPKVLKHELVDSIDFMRFCFNTDQVAYVPPEASMTEEGYKVLKNKGIYAVRMGQKGMNSLKPKMGTAEYEWMNLATMGIGEADTTEGRNAWVDTAIQQGKWLIEMWHDVSPNGDVMYQPISTAKADEHLSYMAQKQKAGTIWVASFVEATKYIYECENAEVKAIIDDDKISVSVACDKEKLPSKIFNEPLTVKVPMPYGWENVKAYQNQVEVKLILKEQNGIKYVLTDCIPNEGTLTVEKK